MSQFLVVLGYTALPYIGNFGGGLIAEYTRVSNRTLSLALHVAAGIVLAVVGVELMPRVIEATPPWVVILAFIGGGVFSIGVDYLIKRALSKGEQAKKRSGTWAIYFATSVDLFSDGVMIGTGSTLSSELGLLLALGQLTADVPEGFATIASFKGEDTSRKSRLLASAAFALPLFLGATIGYWLVRGGSDLLKLSLLAFTAAILTKGSVEEMVTEAHKAASDSSLQAFCFIGGFALFTMISIYLG